MSLRSSRLAALSTVCITSLTSFACASKSHTTPDPASAVAGTAGPANIQWVGSFQALQQQNGNAEAPRGRNNASGHVELTAAASSTLRARITLSVSGGNSQYFHWALVTGRCGSPALPLLTVNQFPDISMTNGRGQVDAEVPLRLPTTGTYHVDVFWSNGQDQADVMTCANLRAEHRSE